MFFDFLDFFLDVLCESSFCSLAVHIIKKRSDVGVESIPVSQTVQLVLHDFQEQEVVADGELVPRLDPSHGNRLLLVLFYDEWDEAARYGSIVEERDCIYGEALVVWYGRVLST